MSQNFTSAGVTAREIDLTGRKAINPTGIPAGVIGTANAGPAFVPVTVSNDVDLYNVFGVTDGEKFGPMAAVEWLRNADSVTYLRVLGAGTCEQRDGTGVVTGSGFIVGGEQVQTNGLIAGNPYAISNGDLGRLWFLGTYMSQSAGSTIFADAGLSGSGQPIIRAVLMAASGVIPFVQVQNRNMIPSTTTPAEMANSASLAGYFTGTVDTTAGGEKFVLLLNGHKGTDPAYPNFITSSFDPAAVEYIANVFNKDPEKLEEAGYVLYTHYDIYGELAVATGSGGTTDLGADLTDRICFILPGTGSRNSGDSDSPSYESFQDRFTTAFSPWVISQKFGADNKNLFKVEALSDGVIHHPNRSQALNDSNNLFKISIQNVTNPLGTSDPYGTFDLVVRDFYDRDDEMIILEQFRGLTLNPASDKYVARVIGDQNVFFDFDKSTDRQKLIVEGNFENNSNYVRVVMSSDVENGRVDSSALPVGFRGPYHLVTAGTSMLRKNNVGVTSGSITTRLVEPPIPYRTNLTVGSGAGARTYPSLHWGVQFEKVTDLDELNSSKVPEPTIESLTKYFPLFNTTNLNVFVGDNAGTANLSGSILDSDRFNYNKFTLENIQVVTGSDGKVDMNTVDQWTYVRADNIVPNEANKTRALSVETDFSVGSLKQYNKFSFFLQAGFDGVRIFNADRRDMSDRAIRYEIDDSDQGGTSGPTVSAYVKALDIMKETADVDMQLLAVPGIRNRVVTDRALTAVEDRFDAMYLMDIEEVDDNNSFVTSSVQLPNVQNTALEFSSRGIDSSFGAAYFPNVIMPDPSLNVQVEVPPSVAVLGALALNDRIGHPWFAPAGFTRGALQTVESSAVSFNRSNLDRLYEVNINPLTSFPSSDGVVVWGQKTLQAAQSSLDRVNVRRLLIDLRRQVRRIANTMLFEPNRDETLARFTSQVQPILQRIQEQQGVDRYKVIIDATTTTQADVENNTIRGKIYIQPTRTAEFISLDFNVTNAGQQV